MRENLSRDRFYKSSIYLPLHREKVFKLAIAPNIIGSI